MLHTIVTPHATAASIAAVFGDVPAEVAEAAARATFAEQTLAPRGMRYVATYETAMGASMGYGPDTSSARAALIATLAFNLAHNGRVGI